MFIQVSERPLEAMALYQQFLDREDDSSGTVVLHHGRVKRPGKQVADFSRVRLEALCGDPQARLKDLCLEIEERHGLRQIMLVHRLGVLQAGETVLVAMVSAVTREVAFDACRELVDLVKKENIIRLVEEE